MVSRPLALCITNPSWGRARVSPSITSNFRPPMTMFWGYFLCAMATCVIIAGDYYFKLAIEDGDTLLSGRALLGVALYAASAALWFASMRFITLAQVGVAASIFTLLALTALGHVFFQEKIAHRDVIGISLAIGAVLVMARAV
ncbi:EamA family transporter [Donghicola mangrovi]|nr:EamA family transporter [Donghicola mangrovi]